MDDPCKRCEDDYETPNINIPIEKRKKIEQKLSNIKTTPTITQSQGTDALESLFKKKEKQNIL